MKFKLILASNSPRRKELLSELGLEFSVKTKPVEESFPNGLTPAEVAEFLAKKKSDAYAEDIDQETLIITADTLVSLSEQILNKPYSSLEAKKMLQALSENTHEVITGVALLTTHNQRVFSVTSKVTFEKLTDSEIDEYVASGSPLDKAGAYGIQDWIGKIAISKIEGSYENIVGLPTQRLYQELQNFK